ncbi:Helix-turn-helix domain-containing protein [Chryseobacterium arachidis]|uniref:Helix-turn-helix domain-containing protein n=1 Tax=Chryseobacterium arachidis TaxID=1416778 RepID=A0A1M4WYX9_9FLAO|nr:helix-turn-helix domain-containing protein [Chryseobacterium arachidis]SHE86471.1 Helix-turn-helix domain-containing protein [Chryseobacterium arachidis]
MMRIFYKNNSYKDISNTVDSFKKQFGRIFFLSVAGVFLLYLVLSLVIPNFVIVPIGVLVFAFFLTVYTGFIISKTRFDFIIIFRILVTCITIFITYISLLLANVTEAVFFLFVPVILMINFLFSFRIAGIVSFILFCYHFFASEISVYFKMALDTDFYRNYPQNLVLQENIGYSVAIYFSLLILYYTDKIFHLKIETAAKTFSKANTNDELLEFDFKNQSESLTDEEKYNILFKKIISCLETDKPYQDPDFNIRKLADMVQSNTTYVSKAMNKVGDKKFSQIINDYRIQQVKIDFDNRAHHKFTIEHIYKAAGFSQQSTFNRIFKEYMGKTPTEYIEFLKKEDNTKIKFYNELSN